MIYKIRIWFWHLIAYIPIYRIHRYACNKFIDTLINGMYQAKKDMEKDEKYQM